MKLDLRVARDSFLAILARYELFLIYQDKYLSGAEVVNLLLMVIIAGLVDGVTNWTKLVIYVVAGHDEQLKGRVLSLHLLVAIDIDWDAVLAPVKAVEVAFRISLDVCKFLDRLGLRRVEECIVCLGALVGF